MATGDLHNAFMAQMGGHQINTGALNDQTKQGKDWISQNLNNIGGGAGATGGALGGAAIGTAILPGIGTVGGGIIGALLGGAGGGYVGEQAKQSAEGNYGTKSANNEAGKQALVQGLYGAGGEGAGALVGHFLPAALEGGGALTRGLESFSGKKVAQQVASNLPKDALQTGNDIARLTSNSELLSGLGLYNNAQRGSAAQIANDVIGGVKNQALKLGGDVPVVDGLAHTLTNAVTDSGLASKSEQTAVQRAVKAAVSKAVGSEGSVSGSASAQGVFDLQKQLETLGNTAYRSGNAEKAAVYKTMADHFGNLLDTHAGTNAMIAAHQISPETAAQITQRAVSALGKSKGTALADHLIEGVNRTGVGTASGGGMADIRDLLSTFVPANKAATNATISGLQATTPSVLETVPGAVVSPMGKLGAIRSVMGKLSAPEAGVAGRLAQITKPIGQLVSKGANVAREIAPAGPALVGMAHTGQSAQAASDTSQSVPTDTAPQDQPDQSSSVFSPSVLQAMALHDIQTTGGKNINQISQLASLFGPNSKLTSGGATTAQKSQQLNSKNALTQLDNIESTFNSAGGGGGFLGGHLASNAVSDALNIDPYKAYNKTLIDAVTAYAKAVTGSARPAASVIQQFKDSFPSPTDSPTKAAQKLQILRQNVQGTLKNSTTALDTTQ